MDSYGRGRIWVGVEDYDPLLEMVERQSNHLRNLKRQWEGNPFFNTETIESDLTQLFKLQTQLEHNSDFKELRK